MTIIEPFQLLCGKDLGNYYFDEFSITDTTLSQDDTIVESDFIIFPNPFENYFEIHSNYKIDLLELYSIDGRKVIFSISDEKIYLSSLAKGVYLLKINSDSKIFFKKIIHK